MAKIEVNVRDQVFNCLLQAIVQFFDSNFLDMCCKTLCSPLKKDHSYIGNQATATPLHDYLPGDTDHVYDIDEEWLRTKVEKAERLDYEFAVRMQGLSNSNISAMWTPSTSSPITDNGHGIMQRFAETMVNHFYDRFIVQEKADYSPESVVREVVHMHKVFSDEWSRQNKNTLSPQLEALGEAYVSLFYNSVLSSLKDKPPVLVARLLRRHERYRPQFGLCLQHYMAKMEGDRIGRSPSYKQTNILANQNMLAVKSMAGFIQSNITQIVKEINTPADMNLPVPHSTDTRRPAEIPPDILTMFNQYTMDWFEIADQLPPPRGRFPGYKHMESVDQDPYRQSKWQKISDFKARGGT